MIDSEIFKMLNNKLDNVTEELVSMKTSINNIESNTEITMMNGGGMEVTMKTNVLLKNLYEHTKPGGTIDEKFKACRIDHSPQKRFGVFNKTASVYMDTIKIFGTVALIIMIIINFFVNSTYEKKSTEKFNTISNKIEMIEKIAK